MATPLVEKLEQEFLSCCICYGELRDPIGLPCLHAFCFKCLEEWFKTCSGPDKSTVTCLTCKESFPTPKGGIRGFPKHFLINNLKETVALEKQEKDVKCAMCGKKADNHCIDCQKSLCQQCLRNHDGFIKDHKVITILEYQSGAVSDEGRFCKVHSGEKVRYYCETEQRGVCADCVGLKTCSSEHHRTSLKEAAQKQKALLKETAKRCSETRTKFQDAVDEVKRLKNNLKQSGKIVNTKLDNLESNYNQRVKQRLDKLRGEVKKYEAEKERELDSSLQELELVLGQIESVCDQVSMVERATSEYLVTHKYPSLSETMTQLSKSKLQVADPELGYVGFEPEKSEAPPFGHVVKSMGQRKRWKLKSAFVAKQLDRLQGIAIDKNGNILVCSFEKGIKAYTTFGEMIGRVYDHGAVDVACSESRYFIAPLNQKLIQCNDMQGSKLFDIPITNVNNKPSIANSVAVDYKGRIIVGHPSSTISIHNPDGSCLSKFATESMPYRLAVSSNEEIVISYYDPTFLQCGISVVLMDYSGGNVRVIQPPTEVNVWAPSFVCCRHNEMYVANSANGNPTGIYRYTTDGRYIGCVTTELTRPIGIALSKDGTQLYVAEYTSCEIKSFTIV